MENVNKDYTERPLTLVAPDGRTLPMQEACRNPDRWETMESDDMAAMVDHPVIQERKTALLERVSVYMDEHLGEKITLRSVSEHFHVSVSTVTQLFQKRSNVTFHQHLTAKRMRAAQRLISEGTPLEEVGKLVGYADHSSFYRAFRHTFGVSPREYRRGK